MKSLVFAALVAIVSALAGTGPAAADTQSRVIYSHKSWQVRVVRFSDGGLACRATVSASSNSFSVWAGPAISSVRLQFYSSSWKLGNTRANLKVRIDSRPSWRLTNAEMNQHSVLFNLPNSDSGTRFLVEVARGTRLVLMNDQGKFVRSYTLSGSSASMSALIKCVNVLKNRSSGANPFD